MARKTRRDSEAGRVQAAQDAAEPIEPPDGVDLPTDEHRKLWALFSRSRPRESWREFDLVLLGKVVGLEVQIRKNQRQLDDTGPVVENQRGTLVENPLVRVVDTLQRQQLAVVRTLSLGVRSDNARAMNDSGTSAEAGRKTEATTGARGEPGSNVYDLIAR